MTGKGRPEFDPNAPAADTTGVGCFREMPMTAPTPEQMRALADEARQFADAHKVQGETLTGDRYWRMSAALRAAADQLEAVRALPRYNLSGTPWIAAPQLDAILTADTAPGSDE